MAHSGLVMNLLVAAFVLATLAFSNTEAGISDIRRRLSGLRHSGTGQHAHGAHGQATGIAMGSGYGVPQHQHVAEPMYGGHHGYYQQHQPHHMAHQHQPHLGHNNQHHVQHQPHMGHHQAGYYQPQDFRYATPMVHQHQHQHQHQPHHHHQHQPHHHHHHQHGYVAPVGHSTGGAAASSAAAAAGNGGAAASSSAASSSGNGHGLHGGEAAAASAAAAAAAGGHAGANGVAHVVEDEVLHEHLVEPETENHYAAHTGTFADDGHGHESSSYVRETENVENHEDGKEDDNHYYNANSYAKTFDENNHEAYNNADEDVLHTPNVFRSKKSSTNYVKDLNKARRESGSGVLAHDKHSASYNKNSRRFKENVDQRYNKEAAGMTDSHAFATSEAHDDEDIEHIDSDGLGTFVGVDGVQHQRHPGFVSRLAGGGAAASGAASSDGHGQGVATTSAAAGMGATASSSGSSISG